MKSFVAQVDVTGKGAHTMTPEELQHAIWFGLNWHHGHSYTQAVFEVKVLAPDVDGVQAQASRVEAKRQESGRLGAHVFTDDEVDDFYEKWEFAEEDPGRIEFQNLVREIEHRVIQRLAAQVTDGVQQGSSPVAQQWTPPAPVIFKLDPKKPKPDQYAAYTVMQLHDAYRAGQADAGGVGVPPLETQERLDGDGEKR